MTDSWAAPAEGPARGRGRPELRGRAGVHNRTAATRRILGLDLGSHGPPKIEWGMVGTRGEAVEIYLIQHGSNFGKDQDPEEGLTPEGEAVVKATARALARLGVTFDAVIASPKKRARQTAEVAAKEVGFPQGEIVTTELVKAMTPPEETIDFLAGLAGKDRVLIAGHLPSVAKVASTLLGGGEATIAFERGGVCRIDIDRLPGGTGRLIWYLPPAVTALMAG